MYEAISLRKASENAIGTWTEFTNIAPCSAVNFINDDQYWLCATNSGTRFQGRLYSVLNNLTRASITAPLEFQGLHHNDVT
jgi:hypothetical protein